jgi:hypothetical protein
MQSHALRMAFNVLLVVIAVALLLSIAQRELMAYFQRDRAVVIAQLTQKCLSPATEEWAEQLLKNAKWQDGYADLYGTKYPPEFDSVFREVRLEALSDEEFGAAALVIYDGQEGVVYLPSPVCPGLGQALMNKIPGKEHWRYVVLDK